MRDSTFRRRTWLIRGVFLTLCGLVPEMAVLAQTVTGPAGSFAGITNLGSAGGGVSQMAFAPGDPNHLYVSTFGAGIRRFDYDPAGGISNGVTVVPAATSSQGGVDGSLGIAFHQDATLGTVMYIAPSVPFGGGGGIGTNETQSIVRLTDTNGDGTWGGTGDVNQAVVNNLQVTRLHQVNQMQVHGNRLYVGIGSRTQNGGITTPSNGDQSNVGEHAYTGAVNFIDDLTQLSGDTATANLAGFTIANHKSDTQMFTSTDAGKLRVFSTGLRNGFGVGVAPGGDLWVSMNQNEDPLLPDELHISGFQDDHGFAKANDVVGDWKTSAHASAAQAQNAGYFQNTVTPLATLGNHAAAGGLDFITTNAALLNHAVVSRWSFGDIVAVDPANGNLTQVAAGFSLPLDVLTDPQGNLLVAEQGGSFDIHRIDVVQNIPEPTAGTLLLMSLFMAASLRRGCRSRAM